MSKARFLWILLLASMTIVGQGKLLWRDSFSPNKSALTDTGKGTSSISNLDISCGSRTEGTRSRSPSSTTRKSWTA